MNIFGLREEDIPIQRQGNTPSEDTLKTIKRLGGEESILDNSYHLKISKYFKVH